MTDISVAYDDLLDAVRAAAAAERLVAFGGAGLSRKPLAAARAIARAGIGGLRVLAHVGGPEVDLLVAQGLVREVVFSYVGFDVFGVAPHFRRAREAGALRAREWSEFGVLAGLRAAAEGLPFYPVRGGLASGVEDTCGAQRFPSPFGGDTLLALPPLQPAVCILHANAARPDGAVFIGGDAHADRLLAQASDTVFVTIDSVALHPDGRPLLLAGEATGIITAPGGSGFTACAPERALDVPALLAYLEEAAAPAAGRGGAA